MRFERRPIAQRLKQMRDAERVDGDRLDRIGDGAAHQRLGGEMQHDFGVGGGDRGGDRFGGAQIAEARIEILGRRRRAEQRRVRVGRQREAGRPRAEPASAKARSSSL